MSPLQLIRRVQKRYLQTTLVKFSDITAYEYQRRPDPCSLHNHAAQASYMIMVPNHFRLKGR